MELLTKLIDSRQLTEVAASVQASLRRALCFDVCNVYDYVNEIFKTEKDHDISSNIPNAAPLADSVWMEWRTVLPKNGIALCGVLQEVIFDRKHSEDGDLEVLKRFSPKLKTAINFNREVEIVGDEQIEILEETRWIVAYLPVYYMMDQRRFPLNHLAEPIYVFLRDDGSVMHLASEYNIVAEFRDDLNAAAIVIMMMRIALTGVCFSHCRGVTTEERKVPRQEARLRQRQGKEPVVSWKVLNIHPVRKVLSGEGSAGVNGVKKALHICRGHFAHYSADAPLFGKYVGTVYHPMHVRGNIDEGVSNKAYKVHTS